MKTRQLSLLDWATTLFVFTAVPSLFMGYDRRLGTATIAVLFGGLLLYWIVSRWTTRPQRWDIAAKTLTFIGGLFGLYFISQAGRLDYAEKVSAISVVAGLIARFTPDVALLKPHTNSVAVFLEGIFFVALGITMEMKGHRRGWVWIALTGLIGFAVILSASRGSWLAIFTAGLIWLAFRWRPARWILLGGAMAALALAVYVLSTGAFETINSIPVFSSLFGPLFFRPDRVEVYRNSLALIAEYPFTGIGLGEQFGMVYSRYQLLLPYLYLTYSHNLYLEVWLQQGLVGAAAWIGLLAVIGLYLPKPCATRQELKFESAWIGLIAMLLHGFTDARMYADLWCWLPFFWLISLVSGGRSISGAVDRRNLRWVPLAAVGSFLLLAGVALYPLSAAWSVNIGSLNQTRSDLAPGITTAARALFKDRAAVYFLRSIESNPNQRPANYRLGMMKLEELKIDDALVYLINAHQANPDHLGTQKSLGLALTYHGDLDLAEPLLMDKLQIVEELNYLGWFHQQEGRVDFSLNAYRMSLRLNPDQPDLVDYLSQIEDSR